MNETVGGMMAELARLKAENRRLEQRLDSLQRSRARNYIKECKDQQAEIERLTQENNETMLENITLKLRLDSIRHAAEAAKENDDA